LVILTWGLMPSVLKYFTTNLDAPTMMGYRLTLCSLVWLPAVIKGHLEKRVTKNLLLAVIPPAVVFFLGQVLWSLAPYYNDASILLFIGRTSFLFAMLFGFWLVKSERALLKHRRFWWGLLAIAVGMTTLFLSAYHGGSSTMAGLIIMLGAAVCWGLHGPFVKKFLDDVSMPLGFGLVTLYMMPCALLILFTAGEPTAFLALSSGNLWFILFASIIPLACGQALLFYAFQRLGPVVVEGGFQSMPFVAAFVAYIWLGEEMSLLQWLAGGGVLIGAVLLLSTKMKR
jgi:drug/metabolite transporter (DMT)-like permease